MGQTQPEVKAPGRWRQTLLARWLPLFLTVQLLLFVAAGVWLWHQTEVVTRNQAREQVATLAVALHAAFEAPLLTRDLPLLTEIAVEMVRDVQTIDYLAVINAAGERLAVVGLPEGDAPLPAAQPLADFLLSDQALPERVELAIPLGSGTVQVGYSFQPLTSLLNQFAVTTSTLVASLLAVTSLLFLLFFLRLARRLAVIEAGAAEIARDRLAIRLPEGEEDELARLGTAFNQMAEALSERIAALTLAERETQHALGELEVEHAHLTALLEAMRMGVLLVDSNNQVLFANRALRRLWLIPEEAQIVGRNARQALSASTTQCAEPDHFSKLLLTIPGTQEVSDSAEIHLIDGRILLQLCYPVRDPHQRLIGRLWLFEDVTRERRAAEQLIYLAERDGLTGLYNRRRFAELLHEKLSEAERQGRQAALLLFDLDEFKSLNESFGHRAGDALLARVASELIAITRQNEIVARLGGDEFAVLLPAITDKADARHLAERIVRTISRIPFEFDGQRLGVTVSLGIACFPTDADNPDELVVAADLAMYQAKNAGRNAWRFYEHEEQTQALARLSWNQRIEQALTDGLFELHFQGIHHDNGHLSHVEALIRMRDPEAPDRLVSPAYFIPAAEKSGKIREIDRWVITTALATLAAHPEAPRIAVNLSARTLSDPDFPLWLETTWRNAPPHARRLLFEITETAAIGDLQEATRFARFLHQLGASLCLDDFGSGFSSFSYLKYLSADIVKIDGQFVRNLTSDRNDRLIVQAIAQVARGMGKMTVAEFVEDGETFRLLKELGVEAAQGYYLSRPTPDITRFFSLRR